jgi:hypothetical protein
MNPGLELVMTLRVEIAPSLEWNTVYLMDTITVLRAKMYPPPVAPAG